MLALFGVLYVGAPELLASSVKTFGFALATAPLAVVAEPTPTAVSDSDYSKIADVIAARMVEKMPAPEPAKPVDVRVVADEKESRGALAVNFLNLLRGVTENDYRAADAAVDKLIRGGHYGKDVANRIVEGANLADIRAMATGNTRAAGDWYSLLVDADGKYLIPTVVRDGIDRVAEEYGVMRRISDVWPAGIDKITRVISASGSMRFYPVAEGAVIKSRKRAFGAVLVSPKKWALITPWTYETDITVAAKILEDVQFQVGISAAFSEDDACINGDGTSTYNSITGIINGASVKEKVIAGASFESVTASELILAKLELIPGFRKNLAYVFHPDMEIIFSDLKDNAGQFIFKFDSEAGVYRIKGVPVYYTEALPSNANSDLDTVFGIVGDFRFWKLGMGPGMSMEMMNQGEVEDADTGTAINLNTQDVRAAKFRHFFDGKTNFTDAFCVLKTAAST